MAKRVLQAKLRTGWCVVGLGLCVGMASSAVAAPVGPKERDTLLRQHGAWADRARTLKAVAGFSGQTLRDQRAACWGVRADLPGVLRDEIAANEEALEAGFKRLEKLLAPPESTPPAPEGAGRSGTSTAGAEVSAEQLRAELLQRLEVMERRQAMLEAEVLQPRATTPALVSEVIRERTRLIACEQWMKGWNEQLASSSSRKPAVAHVPKEVDERIRWDFLDRAADGDVFNANNSGLPSVLTDEAGVTERLGGPDALAASLAWALGSMEETTGLRGIITFNPTFPFREVAPPTARNATDAFFIRFQVPVTTTLTDDAPPPEGEPRGRLRRYALTLGYDFKDFRDPRRWKRLECLQGVEALTPQLGVPAPGAISSLAVRRRPLYARCLEEGADANVRMGLRGSAQLLSVDAAGGEAVRAGPLAFGFILEPTRYLAAQLTWRHAFWPREQNEYVLSAHLGTGLPRPAFGTDSLVRLGLDASLTFNDRGPEETRAQWLLAPSLLVRLNPYVFATVSLGYLRGFSESGMMTNLGLTVDADPALTYRVPPPAP